jgi:6-phosphofructokinase 1
MDRVLASRLGHSAVEGLIAGNINKMVGIVNNKIKYTSFESAISKEKEVDNELVRMAEILAL